MELGIWWTSLHIDVFLHGSRALAFKRTATVILLMSIRTSLRETVRGFLIAVLNAIKPASNNFRDFFSHSYMQTSSLKMDLLKELSSKREGSQVKQTIGRNRWFPTWLLLSIIKALIINIKPVTHMKGGWKERGGVKLPSSRIHRLRGIGQ